MATQLVTFKIDKKLLKQVDEVVKQNGYQNRTEFIRKALRENVNEQHLKKTMQDLAKFKGSVKKRVTEEEYERVRASGYELLKNFKGFPQVLEKKQHQS